MQILFSGKIYIKMSSAENYIQSAKRKGDKKHFVDYMYMYPPSFTKETTLVINLNIPSLLP